jgi:hypothetical protein
MLSDLTVVVRGAGERTEELCCSLIQREVLAANIHLVHEKPFAKAQEKSIQIAMDAGTSWSVFIDADILIADGIFETMTSELQQYTDTPFYMCNFALLDRGFSGYTYGIHCYKTELFAKAKKFLKVAMTDQRPETRIAQEMGKTGYPTIVTTTVVGLHDYEQYYRDLYRKMYTRGIKFNRLADYMRSSFELHYLEDDDYRIMLAGLTDGLLDYASGKRYAPLETDYYHERSAKVMTMLRMEEKPPLEAAELSDPRTTLDGFAPDDLYLSNRSRLLVGDKTTIVDYKNKDSVVKRAKKTLRPVKVVLNKYLENIKK